MPIRLLSIIARATRCMSSGIMKKRFLYMIVSLNFVRKMQRHIIERDVSSKNSDDRKKLLKLLRRRSRSFLTLLSPIFREIMHFATFTFIRMLSFHVNRRSSLIVVTLIVTWVKVLLWKNYSAIHKHCNRQKMLFDSLLI